jgi:hypothetical protein
MARLDALMATGAPHNSELSTSPKPGGRLRAGKLTSH